MQQLHGKIALITGAASGIGRATAEAFAREGTDVVIADVNESGLKSAAESIRALGRKVVPIKADVSRRDEVEALVKEALAAYGRVDILMNNAGVGLAAEIKDMELSDWEWIMGINLWGTIYSLHYLLPHMVQRKSGHIVNVASGAGLCGLPISGAYTTTKFGLVGLSEVLRTELEGSNIGVTVVCPGVVKTNIFSATRVKGFPQGVTQLPDYMGMSSEKAATRILQAVKRNEAVLVLTPFAKVTFAVKRISPALGRQVARSVYKYFMKQKLGDA